MELNCLSEENSPFNNQKGENSSSKYKIIRPISPEKLINKNSFHDGVRLKISDVAVSKKLSDKFSLKIISSKDVRHIS